MLRSQDACDITLFGDVFTRLCNLIFDMDDWKLKSTPVVRLEIPNKTCVLFIRFFEHCLESKLILVPQDGVMLP